MMVRETTCPERFPRPRPCPTGAQIVISPWHLHRHERLWDNPDGFDPGRWQTENGKTLPARGLHSLLRRRAGLHRARASPWWRGRLLLAMLVRAFRFERIAGRRPGAGGLPDGARARRHPAEGQPALVSLGRRISTGLRLQNTMMWPLFSNARKPRAWTSRTNRSIPGRGTHRFHGTPQDAAIAHGGAAESLLQPSVWIVGKDGCVFHGVILARALLRPG